MKQGLPTEPIITYFKTKIFWFMASLLILAGSVYSLLQGGSMLKYIMALIGSLIGLPMAIFSYVDLRQLRKS
jgi:membrane associated rhomboid family serine protease